MRRGIAPLALALLLAAAASGAQDSAPATRPTTSEAPGRAAAEAAAAEAAGKHKEAAELFAKAVQQAPTEVEPRRGLVRCLAAHGAINDALDHAEDAVRAFPKDAELHALVARVLSLKGEELRRGGFQGAQAQLYFEDAARTARKSLELDAGHRDGRLVLAQSLLQLGKLAEAEKEATDAASRFASHPGGPLIAGEIAFERFLVAHRELQQEEIAADRKTSLEAEKEKQFQAASAYFRNAISRDQKRARAWRLLGDLLAWKGKDTEVLDCLKNALGNDPEGGARHEFIQERYPAEAAAKLYADAAALHAKNHPAAKEKAAILFWYQGYHLYRAKRFKESVAPFEEALRRNPTYRNALYYLARAEHFDGDEKDAQKHLVRYATEDAVSFADLLKGLGKEGDATTNLLVYMADKANREGAAQDCRSLSQVLALVRDTADDWNNYAFLCRETSEFEKSYEAYRRALEKSPDDPALLNDCALILQYHLHRDLDVARKMYEQALEAAQKVLRDPKSDATGRARARQAISDAKGNLAKLKS